MKNDIPQQLRTAFAEKKLIPVVAAGVSMSLKNIKGEKLFPSWPELLEQAAVRLDKEGKPDHANGIRAMLALKKYKDAADIAKEGLTGGLWSQFFNSVFDVDSETIDPESLSLPKAIWTLSERIITLNYEKVMRIACPRSLDMHELDNTTKDSLADFNRNTLDKPSVWHLHGRIGNLEKIIFTSDSYCKLYLENDIDYQAALETLRGICSTNNLLFIGCSLDDAELLKQLGRMHDIFSGNTGPHYAFVRQADLELIRGKLKEFPSIEILSFSDFGQPLLDKISEITTENESSKSDTKTKSTLINKSIISDNADLLANKRIAILSANPIGEAIDYSELIKEFKSIKCTINLYPLTEKNLNTLENFDYIFILSNLIKNKIIIEDEALQSTRIGLKELEENIGNSNTDGVFIFLNYNGKLDHPDVLNEIATLSLPTLVLPALEKEQISSFIFKTFKKNNLDCINNSVSANLSKFKLTELKGKNKINPECTSLPDAIDPKTTRHYVGRKTDLQNICREIVALKDKNEVLTIKGSGGIGKTITTKKIAVALAERNHFPDGIYFVDCEFIKDTSSFIKNIAISFNLENAINIKESIKSNFDKQDKLIILDNVETLLHLVDTQKIKDFIYFICDYANIVITSRELLDLDCEQVYELRNFSTDEAYDLFTQQLGRNALDEKERNFVRQEIIENLLDNNPLAISIIANNIPKGKSFYHLKQELESDIFRKISYAELFEFDKISDENIERKKSLYASINFSYLHLSDSEKMAFELLSLFPDGINMENLKRIAQHSKHKLRNPDNKPRTGIAKIKHPTGPIINDSVIKSLENKSMMQIDHSTIKLQSIIGKFAELKLKERSNNELYEICKNAIRYNLETADILTEKLNETEIFPYRIFNKYKENFFKSIEYLTPTSTEEKKLVNYLDDLMILSIATTNADVFERKLEKKINSYTTNNETQLALDLILLTAKYYSGHFEESFLKLKEILPLDTLTKLNPDNSIVKNTIHNAIDIYRMEGELLIGIGIDIKIKYYGFNSYPSSFLHLGHVNHELLAACKKFNFFTLQAYNIIGEFNDAMLEKYAESIYENDHLELMQMNYLKIQFSIAKNRDIDKGKIKKLNIVNPYTLGLQQLMLALSTDDIDEKISLFEQALSNLKHIRYYYVEALLHYARSLREFQHLSFENIHQQGIDLARTHHYYWLCYQFEDLLEKKLKPYSMTDYHLPVELDLDGYANLLIKSNCKRL